MHFAFVCHATPVSRAKAAFWIQGFLKSLGSNYQISHFIDVVVVCCTVKKEETKLLLLVFK